MNEPKAAKEKRMIIDITRMTVHNGPGIRTLILFKGCPLRCIWCSTPESQDKSAEIAYYPEKCNLCGDCIPVCPGNALTSGDESVIINRKLCDNCGLCVSICYSEALNLVGEEYTVEELVHEVEKDEVVYKHSGGGVTISGGEPLLEPEFTLELLHSFKQNNINTGVDTCGFVPRDTLESVLSYVDFFLWDIKHMNSGKHVEYTGVSNEFILDNLRFVSDSGTPVYLRLPLIPGYNDSEDNLRDVCEFAKDLSSLVEIDLLPLHHLGKVRYAALGHHYPIEGIPLIRDEVLQEKKNLVESYGLTCNIIG
ncbi:MAG: glycyl-radical enzyme activating protein [Dehalococcoidales bacterium]|nr:MAG: glycyl-radical enzyme activating protein [Dehalococcoidales bacterium]